MARILIVDDDPQTLDALDFSLVLDGHETVRATNGAECIDVARRGGVDLIVLDCMMPVMDGVVAARLLREDPSTSGVPIIMLTARVTDADMWRGYQSGVASYVTKPLDLDVLQREIAQLCPSPALAEVAR
jgi:CheY-like chemotaxis protein